MTEQDALPLLGEFVDDAGRHWAFDAESISYLETEEGDPFWHVYCYHSLDHPTAKSCAALLKGECGQKAE
ncbi:hypothetical protein [Gibbsiella quercinecans]|uniref:hypothetical protein n=1 Tax=Gibbsiella quercinecans TaxID=929813 RepID=UPI0011C3F579|nr:hypothetical protein [Gibbsiella quercinecans]